MNGKAFANLPNLERISLLHNFCIDTIFYRDVIRTTAHETISSSCGFEEINSVEIFCERFDDFGESEFCGMDKKTKINASNFVIGELRDEAIEGIDFSENKKIEYLPYKIYMQFPNLVDYRANQCTIKQITKANFENLNRLKYLKLSSNKIQKIFGNTFHGLGNLREVDLSEFLIFQ